MKYFLLIVLAALLLPVDVHAFGFDCSGIECVPIYVIFYLAYFIPALSVAIILITLVGVLLKIRYAVTGRLSFALRDSHTFRIISGLLIITAFVYPLMSGYISDVKSSWFYERRYLKKLTFIDYQIYEPSSIPFGRRVLTYEVKAQIANPMFTNIYSELLDEWPKPRESIYVKGRRRIKMIQSKKRDVFPERCPDEHHLIRDKIYSNNYQWLTKCVVIGTTKKGHTLYTTTGYKEEDRTLIADIDGTLIAFISSTDFSGNDIQEVGLAIDSMKPMSKTKLRRVVKKTYRIGQSSYLSLDEDRLEDEIQGNVEYEKLRQQQIKD